MKNYQGMRWVPGPEALTQQDVREQQHEMDATTERERMTETVVPRRHLFRTFLSKFRRKR